MSYRADIIPTMTELNAGSLEPATNAFKNAVMLTRMAPLFIVTMTVLYFIGAQLGLTAMPGAWFTLAAGNAAFYMLIAMVCSVGIRMTRRPSPAQIRHLARLVRLDPSLAHKVNALGDRDYTFARLQAFIAKNSARANEVEMKQAMQELEAAVAGK